MSTTRIERKKQLFEEALDQPESRRLAFLDSACSDDPTLRREVERLVEAHEEAGSFLESPILVADLPPDGEASLTGQHIGPYRVERELGRGGMGTVYLAVRDDEQYNKQVAIKVIKRGMDTDSVIQRFRRERQILASLDHPNIARLLDGGVTADRLPYFVMEYIEGQSITEYADAHKLSTIDRLKLFRTVCAAIQFAHQNLVIHRDIKPGNILVTKDGTPKLLDFGIAKLLDAELWDETVEQTATSVRLMTPEYASPEQVRGAAVTTASDVYSLGVVLYELLSGHPPYRFTSRRKVARLISEQ